jgi:hypothetical protein
MPPCGEENPEMDRLLWRLDGISSAPHVPERLADGLRLHLEHTELVSILAQIGEMQQAYISTLGCESCHLGRHAAGCYVELLRRLLAATFEAVELVPILYGLARRPYTQIVLGRPGKQSVPLSGSDLAGWEEARLVLHWQRGARGLNTAALLAVGDGPDPAVMLGERGWSVHHLPPAIGLRLAANPLPVAVWFRTAWPGAPFLLTPQPVPLALGTDADTPASALAAGREEA